MFELYVNASWEAWLMLAQRDWSMARPVNKPGDQLQYDIIRGQEQVGRAETALPDTK